LEQIYNSQLLGLSGSLLKSLEVRWGVQGIKGNDLCLTINNSLQQKASQLLGARKGAVVAVNPQTGAILAMVSKPGFDPNQTALLDNWEETRKDPQHPLLNRATSGLYPPGSIMKIITLSLGLNKIPQLGSETYNCAGSVQIQGRTLKDTGVHGTVDYRRALAVSCNSYYATLGLRIGGADYAQGLRSFGWGKKIPFDLPLAANPLPADSLNQANGLAEASIGQGKILVTPLSMAMIAGAIGNGGVMMKPYLVGNIKSPNGKVLWSAQPEQLMSVTTPEIAARVKEAMVGVVREGTGKSAAISGIEVAGKTGSAENSAGATHAWFVSFAPSQNPTIAVCVLVENGGAGGTAAAPIARELIKLAMAQGG
jgi:peptidoglycan glycosyltransferase